MKNILLFILINICTLQINYSQSGITKISYFINDEKIELNKNFKIYLYYEDGNNKILYKLRPRGNRFVTPKFLTTDYIDLIFIYQKYIFFEYIPVPWLNNGHLKISKLTDIEAEASTKFFSDYVEGIIRITYNPYDDNEIEQDGVASTRQISDFKQYFNMNKKKLKKALKDW